MAPPTTPLDETLESLTTALSSAFQTFPELESVLPPKNGISLLDVKNDVLLSYLQNLVFLALLRLRSRPFAEEPAIAELIKLRTLLERGVKPLEAKLKYQIDKVVTAVVEAEQAEAAERKRSRTTNGLNGAGKSVSGSESEAEISEDEDDASTQKLSLRTKDLAHRPNPSSMLLPVSTKEKHLDVSEKPGIYRPPRIAATAMPEVATGDKADKRERPHRSHMLDDFVDSELSTVPTPQPSIGSHIASYGRVERTHRDREEEKERQEYEESNFVRLPAISKKEALGAKKRGNAARKNQYGGEDWSSFAGDLDRLTKNVERRGKGEKLLDKARKRRQDDIDVDAGDSIGSYFEKRKGMLKRRRKT